MKRELLEQPFSPDQIKQRVGNFGKTLDYIEGHAVIQRLNDAFEGQWSFHVESHEVLEAEVVVLGILTAEGISKTQFGSSAVTRAKNSGDVLSLADDLKSATTDCLKKCATMFGIALHLYRDAGSIQENSHDSSPDKPIYRPLKPAYTQPAGSNGGNGRGNNGGNGGNGASTANGNNGNGRLSQKQHSFLLHLADDRGVSRKDLDDMSKERFACVVSYLSKNDASSLIQEMTAH